MPFAGRDDVMLSVGEGVLGVLAFAPYLLAPGYLVYALVKPRTLATPLVAERLLWTIALGLPSAVLIAELCGRVLGSAGVNLLFALLLVAALLLAWRRRRTLSLRLRIRTGALLITGLMGLFAVYCLAETVDLQVGPHLYLSTVLADWSVRVAMVEAAIRSAVPPLNGLSTVSVAGLGYAPHLRYYYFWYVLVAQVARTSHVPAQPALAASCIWAGWGFLAAAFLTLRYTIDLRGDLARKCLLLLGLLCVLGLDILPTAWLWFSRSHHPYPEMEWWHQDRTPSFLGSALYAPHHIAAWCSLLVGFLLLRRVGDQREEQRWERLRSAAKAALFAGTAFAAAAGLSLFPTFCFVFVLLFWAVDLVRRHDWPRLSSLTGSGLVALVFAHPYLKELSAGSSAAKGFVNLAWRNDPFVVYQIARTGRWVGHGPLTSFLVRQPIVLALDVFELGFYLIVLVAAVRSDFCRRDRLSKGWSAWWALLLGAAVPALFLTSTATSGPNDLGVDAGFLVRLALQLRAVDWVWKHWRARSRSSGQRHRWVLVTAAGLAILGLAAQIYQALSIRLYYPLVSSHLVHKQIDFLTRDRLSERLYNLGSALRIFDSEVPPSRPDTEAIQFNPVGAMLPAEVYFNDHQIASWDTGCGTSYGGDYQLCAPIYKSLLFLYGNTEAGVLKGRAENDRQDGAAARVATAEDLATVCRHLRLRAVVAESTDSIWRHPRSWVWTGPALVANSTVRVVGCPEGAWRP